MDSSDLKNLARVPTFDGKQENFQVWWTRFNIYAFAYGFKQALKKGGEAALPESEETEIDDSTPEGKNAASAVKRNAIAMVNLTTAFTTDSAMTLIYQATSEKWPSGRVAERMLLSR